MRHECGFGAHVTCAQRPSVPNSCVNQAGFIPGRHNVQAITVAIAIRLKCKSPAFGRAICKYEYVNERMQVND